MQKWCQVILRGTLDENGRFRKFDEAAWEKERQNLAQLLEQNPQAQSLRLAVADRLYWLRREIAAEPTDILLRDRLIAAEPTWVHYAERAGVHAQLKHWDLAIRDELEAARLAGENYWVGGSGLSPDWKVAFNSVQVPGRPPKQYERALRWVEARTRAGVADQQPMDSIAVAFSGNDDQFRPRRSIIAGLGLLRLGRYADALAALQKDDVSMLSGAAGMLMSRWNVLTMMRYADWDVGWEYREYDSDPIDSLLRAMCHHHLGHAKEATALLRQARGLLGTNEAALLADHRALLREAQSLIEGKPRP